MSGGQPLPPGNPGNNNAVLAAANSYATVVGRYLFYDDSYYNGYRTTAGSADDGAIDTGKQALLPGETGSYANYTDSSQGITGVMVDIGGRPRRASFRRPTSSSWWATTTGPATGRRRVAPAVTVRAGAGVGGSDRVELIWPDNTIHNQWLQVTVLADADTGLATPDVFYFGSEPGAVLGAGYASFDDIFAVYRAIGNTPHVTAAIAADVDRDGMVTFNDVFAVYRAVGGGATDDDHGPHDPARRVGSRDQRGPHPARRGHGNRRGLSHRRRGDRHLERHGRRRR